MNSVNTTDRELTTADLAGRTVASGQNDEVRADDSFSDGSRNTLQDRDTPQPMPLFAENEVGDFRAQWTRLQTDFVDEPRRAVEDADKLVASVMQRLAEGFATERSNLESQWDRGGSVSTEELRVALQRYRSFFGRLLTL